MFCSLREKILDFVTWSFFCKSEQKTGRWQKSRTSLKVQKHSLLASCCLHTLSADVLTCRPAELPVVQSLHYTSRCVSSVGHLHKNASNQKHLWEMFSFSNCTLQLFYFFFLHDFCYKTSQLSCSWSKVVFGGRLDRVFSPKRWLTRWRGDFWLWKSVWCQETESFPHCADFFNPWIHDFCSFSEDLLMVLFALSSLELHVFLWRTFENWITSAETLSYPLILLLRRPNIVLKTKSMCLSSLKLFSQWTPSEKSVSFKFFG